MSAIEPKELHRLFAEYFNSGDLESLLGLYEEDAAIVPQPGGEAVSGREFVRQALQGLVSLGGTIRLETRYAIRSGDLALLSCRWHLKTHDEKGELVEMGAKTAEVARLQPDGNWLYVADHPFGGE